MDLNDEAYQPKEENESETPETAKPNLVTPNPNPIPPNPPQDPPQPSRIEKIKHLLTSSIENIKSEFRSFKIKLSFLEPSQQNQ